LEGIPRVDSVDRTDQRQPVTDPFDRWGSEASIADGATNKPQQSKEPRMLNKLTVDTLTTRNHWYPNWVLFRGGAPFTLVRRSAYGEATVAFDAAINSGAAVPIPRTADSICNAMNAVSLAYPFLHHQFLEMLALEADQAQAKGWKEGWHPYLEAAAQLFADDYCQGHEEYKEATMQLWLIWYRYRLHTRFFITALVETDRFVSRVATSMLVFE